MLENYLVVLTVNMSYFFDHKLDYYFFFQQLDYYFFLATNKNWLDYYLVAYFCT